QADCANLLPKSAGADLHRSQLAHLALARAHGHRGIALHRLDAVEPFGHRHVKVFFGDVFALAAKSLALRRNCRWKHATVGRLLGAFAALMPKPPYLVQIWDG